MIDMQTLDLSVGDLLAGKTCETPMMILSDADCPVAQRARAFGVADHVAKPLTRPSLLNAIDRVRATRRLDPGSINEAYQYRQQLYVRLTNREREVMQLAINGHPNKEIGYRLGISQRTVEVHRARLMRKLNVKNLAQLVRLCIENDWS
jgi:two-component system response regulator FixJ